MQKDRVIFNNIFHEIHAPRATHCRVFLKEVVADVMIMDKEDR